MADVQARSGHKYYVEFDGLECSIGLRDFDPGDDGEYVDSTAGSDALSSKHKIREICEPTMTVLLDDSAEGLAIQAKLQKGNTGNLIWGERGNTAGYPKWGISAEVKSARKVGSHTAEQVTAVVFVNKGRDWLFDGDTDTF